MPPFEPDQSRSSTGREALLSGFFVVLAIVLIVLPPQTQEQVAGALRGSVLAPFLTLQESIRQARMRRVEVTDLQERLDAAVAALSAQRTLLDENARLRSLLELRERAGPAFRSASVLRPGTRGSESMFLLDVGSDDGVRVHDPVVSGEGLVGVVREVGRRSSVAMDWTHPDFRVSAMTLDGAAYGMVEPRHGAFREEDRLLLNGVPYYTSLVEGTAIVTSGGQGSVYPRGILVGAIDQLAETEAGWRRGYWIVPAVVPAAVTHVLVITGEGDQTIDEYLQLWFGEAGETGDTGDIGEAGEIGDPAPDPPPPGGPGTEGA